MSDNGLQPHIRCTRAQVAPYALLPGDPARVDRIARHLTDVHQLAFNREFKSIAGSYNGVPVMAVSTGIGGTSTGIATEELHNLGVRAMIRIGSCGALQSGMRLGNLVLVSGAVRDDGASRAYIDPIYPAVADTDLSFLLRQAARARGAKLHVGLGRSHDSFYTDKEAEIDAFWAARGVLCADMETAALYVIGRLRGVRTASLLNVVVEADGGLADGVNDYVNGEAAAARGEEQEILTALDAFVGLSELEKEA